jgi:Zn ribbon nucleic-acid-binding protein
MATRQDGNVRKATPNSIKAAQRSAESRQCPQCGRKSAMVAFDYDIVFGSECRWCGFARSYER